MEREHSIAATDGNYKRQMSGLALAVAEHEKAPAERGQVARKRQPSILPHSVVGAFVVIVVPVVLVFDNFFAKLKEALDPAEKAETAGDLLKILIAQLLQFGDVVEVGGGHDVGVV
ncbi:MAG: hypothetical protein ACO23C_06345 [Prochlorococcaceae cyanobacterium]